MKIWGTWLPFLTKSLSHHEIWFKLKDSKRSQLPYLHQSNQQKRHNFWQFFVAPQRIWSNRLMSSILVADLLLWFPPSWLEKKSFDGNQTMKFIPDPWKLNLAWAAFCRNINITWNLLFSHSTPMIFAQNTYKLVCILSWASVAWKFLIYI